MEYLEVKVKTKSKNSKIVKVERNIIFIEVKSEPENNKANEEILKLIKKWTKSNYKIISGKTNKNKILKKIIN